MGRDALVSTGYGRRLTVGRQTDRSLSCYLNRLIVMVLFAEWLQIELL